MSWLGLEVNPLQDIKYIVNYEPKNEINTDWFVKMKDFIPKSGLWMKEQDEEIGFSLQYSSTAFLSLCTINTTINFLFTIQCHICIDTPFFIVCKRLGSHMLLITLVFLDLRNYLCLSPLLTF